MPDQDQWPKCPGCGASFSAKPFNRNGWYRAECGRRYNPVLGEWEPCEPTGCLSRQVAELKAQRLLLARLAADTPQFDTICLLQEARGLRDGVLAEDVKEGSP